MSINHYFSSGLPEPAAAAHSWWSQVETPARTPPSTRGFPSSTSAGTMFSLGLNINTEEGEDFSDDHIARVDAGVGEASERDKEPLFEKPLTPSDVGKLNRLVIPKQHAERYLPMNGGGSVDSGENGILLNFEDDIGKIWRFRYSYWNSSQSYVLTKGWSRFVKEKRLDAGDVVVFSRHRSISGRLFIGWRRRKNKNPAASPPPPQRAVYSGQNYPSKTGPSSSTQQQIGSSAPTGNSKRLRLFGVNLEFQCDESEPPMALDSPITVQFHPYHHHHHQSYPNQMDVYNLSIGRAGGETEDIVYRQG